MKKKLLFGILMVAILTCLFAIGTFAEDIVYDDMYFTIDTTAKTASFNRTNRTEYKKANLTIPGTFIYDGEEYIVTSILDRSIGYQTTSLGNAYVEYVYIPSTVTYIGDQFVRNCDKLKTVVVDAKVTSFRTSDFQGCPLLEKIDLSGMTELRSLAPSMAASSANLKTVKLPSSLEEIDSKAFQSCGSITSFVIPEGVTTIGSNCFQSTKIQTLVLPSTLNSVGGAAFHSLSTVKTLVFANTSFTGWDNSNAFTSVNPSIIFFAGENPSTLTTHYTQWASYQTMTFEDYLKNPSAVADKKVIVYDTLNCEKCGDVKVSEESFNFTSFTEKMVVGKKCAHCENIETVRTYSAMFECRGFSVSENGDVGITISFTVNGEAVRGYKSETGKDVSYGLFVGIESILGSNDILDQEGNASNGTFVATVDNDQYSILQLKICGFDSEHSQSKFTFGAYVQTTKDSESTLSYLQTGTPAEDEKYYYTTYGDLINA